jgi:dihydroorotate dehydrogenase electron transfer subunit
MRAIPSALAPGIRVWASILENRREGGVNHRLRLGVPGWPGARPGQFVMLSPGAVTDVRRDDPLLPRPMAVFRQDSAPGGEPEVEILYKVTGRGTALLAQAQAGERVRLVGPLGQPFRTPAVGERCAVVGGGTGVASIFGLVAEAPDRGSLRVLLGARSADDLMAGADFERLGVDLCVTTEDGSRGETGLVTAPLERLLDQGGIGTVYCCGPTPMMRRCAELAVTAGVACVVSLENNMACGVGVCLGCAAPRPDGSYALVCRDGPVFDASAILWEALP